MSYIPPSFFTHTNPPIRFWWSITESESLFKWLMQTFKLKNKEPTMGLKVENIFDKVILFLHILSSNDKSLIIYAFYIYIYIWFIVRRVRLFGPVFLSSVLCHLDNNNCLLHLNLINFIIRRISGSILCHLDNNNQKT